MIKTIITPSDTKLHLSIPESYVGKQIEVLLYTTEEAEKVEKITPKKMSDFKGILTGTEAEALQEYVKQSRAEWNQNF